MENFGQPIPIQEAMKNDPEVRALVEKIEKGEIHLCAPFEGMDKPWTEEEKEGLKKALAQFGWK